MPKRSEEVKARIKKRKEILTGLPPGIEILWDAREKVRKQLALANKRHKLISKKADPDAQIKARLKTYEARIRKALAAKPQASGDYTGELRELDARIQQLALAESAAMGQFAAAIVGCEEEVEAIQARLRELS